MESCNNGLPELDQKIIVLLSINENLNNDEIGERLGFDIADEPAEDKILLALLSLSKKGLVADKMNRCSGGLRRNWNLTESGEKEVKNLPTELFEEQNERDVMKTFKKRRSVMGFT